MKNYFVVTQGRAADFEQHLNECAEAGFRVIGFCHAAPDTEPGDTSGLTKDFGAYMALMERDVEPFTKSNDLDTRGGE